MAVCGTGGVGWRVENQPFGLIRNGRFERLWLKLKVAFLARFNDVDFISENDAVETPQPLIQSASVGLRDNPLKFLGIESTDGWGQGVTIAVIDSGVAEHLALSSRHIYLEISSI